jgi:UDP-N-acetylmuramoylalanine--D-glutamate ligase
VTAPRGTFDAREHALVIGLGKSGLASCEILRARGATVFATDEKEPERLRDALLQLALVGAEFVAPDQLPTIFDRLTAAVLSPGVPLDGALVRRVRAAGVPVYSEIEVAYRLGQAPIVAVTGTKGKSTTTALIGHLFAQAGRATRVGGNIGNPLIRETVSAGPDEWIVAEVSSFQLEAIRSFKPRVAVLLNVTPDHLDRYRSMDEYAEAKLRIFSNQGPHDVFIGNLDDPTIGAFAEGEGTLRIPSRAFWYGRTPRRMTTLYVRANRITYAPPGGLPRPVDIMPVDEIPLPGAHNVSNVLAAVLVGLSTGLDPETLRAGVRSFKALPHRLETVAESDGVRFIDDSKSTTPGSVIAALEAFDMPVILIAGGKSKRTDFAAMAEAITRKAKRVVLIGEAADEIASVLDPSIVSRAGSMDEAVALARAQAVPGAVVLLSPGCASFDMFDSAEHRGEMFARAVAGGSVAVHG